MGLRSGLCAGQSSSSTPISTNLFCMDLALCTGALSWVSTHFCIYSVCVSRALIPCALPQALRHEDVFLTSKLCNTQHHPDYVETACNKSLIYLGLEYVGLYLICLRVLQARDVGTVCYDDMRYLETWVAMENLVDKGLVRGIGLSIFNGRQTHDVISISKHKLVVNQVECHPCLSQDGVCVTAYSPLGSAEQSRASPDEHCLLQDPGLGAVTLHHRKTPAQDLLTGVVCIPKSVTPSRILQNLQVRRTTPSNMNKIESFNRNERYIIPAVEVSSDCLR
uniref:Aldo-keto reductase family 1, member A1a (aldehyde reductase) n=1 Tax=Hucho hucho TaxID=62062 RepID=A0A4W5M2Q7_9TELE